MIEKIYIGIAIALVIALLICLVVTWRADTEALEEYDHKINLIKRGLGDTKTQNYKAFLLELQDDLKKHNIESSDKQALKKLANKIAFEEITGKKSTFKKVVNSCFFGLLQGGATGFITGGLPGALGGALVFGTVVPIITTYKELYPSNENLV
jgi:hypothetical protein